MIHKKLNLMIILLLLFGFNTWGFKQNANSPQMNAFSKEIKQSVYSVQTYTPRSPISIYGDTELNNSFPGKGTIDDPIRIEGFDITASSGNLIYIRDTTFYFCISNCNLNGMTTANRGIWITNVDNCAIENNLIANLSTDGIFTHSSTNLSITNNTVWNNEWNGIYLDSSVTSSITNNTVYNCDDGIRLLLSSNNNRIVNNTCYNNNWDGIRLQSSNNYNVITNNTVRDNNEYGIRIEGPIASNNNNVTHNTIHNNIIGGIGVFHGSEHNIIYNNSISDHGLWGIDLSTAFNNTLMNNTIDNSRYGINLYDSKDNTIENNSLTNNGFYIGGSIVESFLQKSILNNSVNGKPLIYWKDRNGGTVPSNAGQIILFNCTYVTIADQNLSKASMGILTAYSSHLTIRNNTLHDSRWGIVLSLNTNKTTISNNTGYNNHGDIQIGRAYNNIVSNNTLGNNSNYGLLLGRAENNTLSNNTIFKTNLSGIWLWDSNNNNNITHNIFYDNEMYGITIDDTASSDTIIKFNDFIGNNVGGSQAIDDGSNNVFEYNYWSDWTNPDVNTDGVVDNSYSIEGTSNNQDLYPLVSSPSTHYLLLPVIISPSSSETLSGDVEISWTPSVDTWGYSVIYNIFYSTDGGVIWDPLIENHLSTDYTWDTTTIPDGSDYLLKIEVVSTGGKENSFISATTFIIDNILPSVVCVHGTWAFNFETGLEGDSSGNDFWWEQVTGSERYLVPLYSNRVFNLGTSTVDYESIDYNYASTLTYSSTPINGSTDNNQIPEGTILVWLTGEGNYVKMRIEIYGYDLYFIYDIIEIPISITTTSTMTTTSTTSATTTTTPSWNALLLLLSLFAMLSWRQRKKKS